MDELTKAEREAMVRATGMVGFNHDTVYAAVTRIKADAHAAGVAETEARVLALADDWERTAPLCSDEEESVRRLLVRELRAALAASSQGEVWTDVPDDAPPYSTGWTPPDHRDDTHGEDD